MNVAGLPLFTIRGERSSGTRWLRDLLADHFPMVSIRVNDSLYGWKHGFWGSDQCAVYQPNHYIVTIRKQPEAWLPSVHDKRYHLYHQPELFSEFIRAEYYSVCDDRLFQELFGLPGDAELPERRADGTRFPNIVEMYKAKLASWDLDPAVYHIQHLRYEELLAAPEETLAELARRFDLPRKSCPILPFARRDYYLNREYLDQWSRQDLDWLRETLDLPVLS